MQSEKELSEILKDGIRKGTVSLSEAAFYLLIEAFCKFLLKYGRSPSH